MYADLIKIGKQHAAMGAAASIDCFASMLAGSALLSAKANYNNREEREEFVRSFPLAFALQLKAHIDGRKARGE